MELLRLDDGTYPRYRGGLADLLDAGGVAGFMEPLPRTETLAFRGRHARGMAGGGQAPVIATAGEVPGYALDPDGAALHGTIFMCRVL